MTEPRLAFLNGYAYFEGQAKDAWANGSRVRKIQEDPEGDITPLGTEGTILASAYESAASVFAFYFILWDTSPGVPIGVSEWKLELVT